MPKTKQGLYICLEGLKGAGKTTLFEYVIERLEKEGVDFSRVSPTRSSGTTNLLERMVKKYPRLKDNRLMRVFLYAQRSNHASRTAEWNKELIIGERSLITSYATKWKKSSILRWLNLSIIDALENQIHSPDYVIYIDVPHDVLRTRIETRDKERDIDDTAERLKDNELAYRHMMNGKSRSRIGEVQWLTVSGVGDKKDVAESVYALIMQKLQEQNFKRLGELG